MGTTCQNSTQIHLQRETASVMLGSTSICMYHLETEHLLLFVSNRNVSIDVSVLSHGLPNLVESTAPALLHRHFILAGPACGLSSKTTPGLILWDLLELLAFKILYHPSERTIHAFWWTTQPSFCYSVVYSEGGKEKTEDREQHSHAGVFIYLTFKSKLFAELSQLLWRQAWRSCYTMATAMDWLCCLKHTHLESI